MQLRYPIDLTIEEYNEQKAWEHAELDHCPFHPEGGCDLARHGTYPRKFPEYCLVPRWYCPSAHKTISLLPDFLASRFPGTLDEIEQPSIQPDHAKARKKRLLFETGDISS
ncbi:conserved hypothetical protein, partial [delta proteobacterium NaphS2]